jgi:hypothetical protein
MEFFAESDLKTVIHKMNAELQDRHNLLLKQYAAPVPRELDALTHRMLTPEGDVMFKLRTDFARIARVDVSS